MIDNIIALISMIRDRANRYIVSNMEKRGLHGLVPSHGTILYSLLEKKKLSMKELAQKTGKDKSTVTALVDKLIAMGYVIREKDADDQRSFCISLTENGESLKNDFFGISEGLMTAIYSGITDEEIKSLLATLNKMKDNI